MLESNDIARYAESFACLNIATDSSKAGHNVNPGQYRAQNEKITDGIRGMFEKFTGKKVRLVAFATFAIRAVADVIIGAFQVLELSGSILMIRTHAGVRKSR
jgi:hypothetical protein